MVYKIFCNLVLKPQALYTTLLLLTYCIPIKMVYLLLLKHTILISLLECLCTFLSVKKGFMAHHIIQSFFSNDETTFYILYKRACLLQPLFILLSCFFFLSTYCHQKLCFFIISVFLQNSFIKVGIFFFGSTIVFIAPE